MITKYSSTTDNPEGAECAAALHNVDDMKFSKDGDFMIMLDECHRSRSLEMITDKDGMEWVAEPLSTHYAFLFKGKFIWRAQEIKLTRRASTLTAIVRHEAMFTYMMQSLMSDARVFEEHYAIRFVDALLLDTAEWTLLKTRLPQNYWLLILELPTYATLTLER